MKSGRIFSSVTNKDHRQQIEAAIFQYRFLIPTIGTLFKNLGYLELCAKILRNEIIDTTTRMTVRQAIFNSHQLPADNGHVEVRENTYEQITLPGWERRGTVLVQLWLFCMRHFSHLSNVSPKKEIGQAIPLIEEPNPFHQHALASLAFNLGIKTEKMEKTLQRRPEVQAAKHFLAQVRPTPHRRYTLSEIEESIQRIINALPASNVDRVGLSEAPRTSSESGEALDRRAGRPFENSYVVDSHFLFLPNMVDHEQAPGEDITSFFVRRDFLWAFFGEPPKVPVNQVRPARPLSRSDSNVVM